MKVCEYVRACVYTCVYVCVCNRMLPMRWDIGSIVLRAAAALLLGPGYSDLQEINLRPATSRACVWLDATGPSMPARAHGALGSVCAIAELWTSLQCCSHVRTYCLKSLTSEKQGSHTPEQARTRTIEENCVLFCLSEAKLTCTSKTAVKWN